MKPVDIPQVLAIFNQIYSSRVTTSLNNTPNKATSAPGTLNSGGGDCTAGGDSLPLQQKLLLASLFLMCSLDQKRKSKEVTLGKLQETYAKVCRKRLRMSGVDLSEVHFLCSLLEARGFFTLKKSNKGVRDVKVWYGFFFKMRIQTSTYVLLYPPLGELTH